MEPVPEIPEFRNLKKKKKSEFFFSPKNSSKFFFLMKIPADLKKSKIDYRKKISQTGNLAQAFGKTRKYRFRKSAISYRCPVSCLPDWQ